MTLFSKITQKLQRSRTARGAATMGVLFVAARAATMLTQILAGRMLGRYEYGVANLVIAAAAYLQIGAMLGFHMAMSHFLARIEDGNAKRGVVSTVLAGFSIWLAIAAAIFLPLQGELANAFGVPLPLLREAAVLALATSVHAVLTSVLLGLRRFALRGALECVYGLGTAVLFLVLVRLPGADHDSLVWAMSWALVLSAAFMLIPVARMLTTKIQTKLLVPVLAYAATASVNAFASASVIAPARLAANAGAGADAVGLMSAYFVVSIQLALALATVLSSFLVPYATEAAAFDKTTSMIRRYWLASAAGLTALFFLASAAGLSVFGKHYPFRPVWSLLFALAATAHVAHSIATSLLAARGLRSLQLSVAGTVISSAANTVLVFPLFERYGPPGAAAALILGYLCSIVFLSWALTAKPSDGAQKTIMTIE